MLKNYISIMHGAALAALMMCSASLAAQTTATGVINGTLNNKDGISIVLTRSGGVTLGAAERTAATRISAPFQLSVRFRRELPALRSWQRHLRYARFLMCK